MLAGFGLRSGAGAALFIGLIGGCAITAIGAARLPPGIDIVASPVAALTP